MQLHGRLRRRRSAAVGRRRRLDVAVRFPAPARPVAEDVGRDTEPAEQHEHARGGGAEHRQTEALRQRLEAIRAELLRLADDVERQA